MYSQRDFKCNFRLRIVLTEISFNQNHFSSVNRNSLNAHKLFNFDQGHRDYIIVFVLWETFV